MILIRRTLSRHEAELVILIALRHMGTRLRLPDHLTLDEVMAIGEGRNDPVALVLAGRVLPESVGGKTDEVADHDLIETAERVYHADIAAEANIALDKLIEHRNTKRFLGDAGDLPIRTLIEVMEDRGATLMAEDANSSTGRWLRDIAAHYRVQL